MADSAREGPREARLAPVVERSLVGFYVIQRDADRERFTYVNPSFAEIFGYRRDEVPGLEVLDLVSEDDRDLVKGKIDRRFEGTVDSVHYEFRGRRKDGRPIWVEVHGSRAEYEDRPALIGTLIDVSERHRAVRALRESEARFRALIEDANDTVAVLDADGIVTYHSPSVTRMLGFEVEDLVGRPALEKVHPEDVEAVREALDDLVGRPGGTTTVEYRHVHADGGWRTLESVGRNLLRDPAIRGIVVNTRDITEAQELALQLRNAQKMEAIGQLAGGVAHDFNNLLTVIQGHAQLLQSRLGDDEHVREIRHAAERAAGLTRQLLVFGRRQVVRPDAIDVSKVLREMRSMLRSMIEESVRLELEAGDTGPVWIDRVHLEQVIMNLVVNARDATPAGGTIRISTREEETPSGRRVALEVSDDGEGMSPAIRERIFEPFFTTREVGKGTGLGLATVYGIVEESGATIDVDSAPGRGTTFTIRFPVRQKGLVRPN